MRFSRMLLRRVCGGSIVHALACVLCAGTVHAGTWSQATVVDGLRINASGAVFGTVPTTLLVCRGPDNNKGKLFQVNLRLPHAETLFSLLLAAQVNGTEIQLYQSGQCRGSNNDQTEISGVKALR